MTDPATTRLGLEQASQRLLGVDHSAKSTTKYRPFEADLARTLGIADGSIYTTYISKAGNARVRFDQSDRSQRAQLLVALIDPPAKEHPMRSVEALERYCREKRSDAEILVLQAHESGAWNPYAVIFVPSERVPLLQPIIEAMPNLRVFSQNLGIDRSKNSSSTSEIPRFIVQKPGEYDDSLSYPYIALRFEDWPDDSFQTLFSVYLYRSFSDRELLGEVKILKKGQRGGKTQLPLESFSQLGRDYCSLGQSFSFYEALRRLPQKTYQAILRGLRDVVYSDDVRAEFENEPGFEASLARTGKATLALQEASTLFIHDSKRRRRGLRFKFETNVGGSSFEVDFVFDQSSNIPDRINAIVGYNGTGKTQLLANIALVATSDLKQREGENSYRGRIVDSPNVRFSSVIAISYSAFDTFSLPDAFWHSEDERRAAEKRLREKGDVFGYAYCGLRKRLIGQKSGAPRGLKNIDELTKEFSRALEASRSAEKRSILIAALSIVLREPSFSRIGLDPYLAASGDDWVEHFDRLSTGHKIVLNIIMQVIAHADLRSIILIDEPESHLHPSLLSALIRALHTILQRLNSYAIVATHSPVVLQEIPRRYVRVLQRFGNKTRVAKPSVETFGENAGNLTTNVFHLDNTETDYHETLKRLAAEMDMDEIEDLFDGEMSAQARAYILSFKHSMGDQ
ncbi:AAA family ATPase [Amycolatopsis sp. NPDC051102]|uniref:AAA family ATPase n=1 Tax=Amycolatopsis sp. NPDC051102 TaxID=3155163 RepID=UPI00342EC9B1